MRRASTHIPKALDVTCFTVSALKARHAGTIIGVGEVDAGSSISTWSVQTVVYVYNKSIAILFVPKRIYSRAL